MEFITTVKILADVNEVYVSGFETPEELKEGMQETFKGKPVEIVDVRKKTPGLHDHSLCFPLRFTKGDTKFSYSDV